MRDRAVQKRALLLSLLALAIVAAGLAPRALAQGSAFLFADIRIPSSNDLKYPHVDTLDRTVYVSNNFDRSSARLVTKLDSAGTFDASVVMGQAEGDPRYTSAAVFTAPNGTIHYAWINGANRRLLLRSKAVGEAAFGPERIVTGTSPFPVEIEVAANEDGVFVFWREPNQPLKYRRSLDGVNWNVSTQTLGSVSIEPSIEVTAAAGRRLAVSITRGLEDTLQGYVGIWNGSTFLLERIPTVRDQNFADPTMAFLPDGTLATALRSTDEEDTCCDGVYVSDRAPNGTWSQAVPLIKGPTKFVSMDADPLGNIHLAWINIPSGNDLWYTTRRAGQNYGGTPLTVNVGGLPLFNVRAAANLSDRSYGHFVAERFAGDVPFGQYYGFGLPVNLVGAQSIAIEDGAAVTNKPALSVSFAGLQGSPTEVRWRWGAPPTDAANDSGGFKALANPLTVAAPALANPAGCNPVTLYTQLKLGSAIQATANSDSIVIDRAVQAGFTADSPTPGFDPSYTRTLAAAVTVQSYAECAGLAAASVSGPISGNSVVLDVVGKPDVRRDITLTGGPGPKVLTFTATDLLGNSTSLSDTIIYDPTPPAFTSAGTAAAVVPDPDASSIVDIALVDAVATDNGRLFGVTVAPLVTPLGGGAPVNGDPVVVPFSEMNQFVYDAGTGKLTLRFSLDLSDSFDDSELVPGRYDLVITMTDGAGNQSLANTVRSINLTEITYSANLPLTKK